MAGANGATGAEIRDDDFVLSRPPDGDRSLSPPEVVRVAARTGKRTVGLRLIRVTETSPGFALIRGPK
jgi:hypothetical protein